MTSPHASGRPATIPALDSVRFIGVLAVLLTHVGFHSGIYTSSGTAGFLISRLSVGVAVFFVLSGFLVSREWFIAAEAGGRPHAGRYYWKRLWRIMPAYLVVTVVCLLAFSSNQARGPRDWLTTLAMADPFTRQGLPTGLGQTWSLSTEVAFYLVLPILMAVLVGSVRRLVIGAVTLGAITLAWLIWMHDINAVDGRPVGEWLPAYLSWFGAGIMLAAIHSPGSSYPRARRALNALAASPGVCWVLVGATLLVAATPLGGPWLVLPLTTGEEITRHVLFGIVGVLVIVPAAFGTESSAWVRFLNRPWMRHLGHISYSVFLVHMGLIQLVLWMFGLVEFGGHFWLILTATLALSLLVAEVLYRVVERPLTRIGRATLKAKTPSDAATNH